MHQLRHSTPGWSRWRRSRSGVGTDRTRLVGTDRRPLPVGTDRRWSIPLATGSTAPATRRVRPRTRARATRPLAPRSVVAPWLRPSPGWMASRCPRSAGPKWARCAASPCLPAGPTTRRAAPRSAKPRRWKTPPTLDPHPVDPRSTPARSAEIRARSAHPNSRLAGSWTHPSKAPPSRTPASVLARRTATRTPVALGQEKMRASS